MGIAILLVVGAVVAMIALGGKKSKDGPAKPGLETGVPDQPQPTGPVEPKELPVPTITSSVRASCRQLVTEIKPLYLNAADYYNEAQASKNSGDTEAWQKMLREAHNALAGANDLWGEIVGQMPANDDWDEDRVASYYFGKASDITKIDGLKAAIRKNLHAK